MCVQLSTVQSVIWIPGCSTWSRLRSVQRQFCAFDLSFDRAPGSVPLQQRIGRNEIKCRGIEFADLWITLVIRDKRRSELVDLNSRALLPGVRHDFWSLAAVQFSDSRTFHPPHPTGITRVATMRLATLMGLPELRTVAAPTGWQGSAHLVLAHARRARHRVSLNRSRHRLASAP